MSTCCRIRLDEIETRSSYCNLFFDIYKEISINLSVVSASRNILCYGSRMSNDVEPCISVLSL